MSSNHRAAAAALVIGVVTLGSGARAASGLEEFGDPGRILVSGSLSLQTVGSDAQGANAVTTLLFAPGAQLFVARNVALGLQLQLVAAGGDASLLSIGLLPSVGYNFEVAAGISWLPQAQVGVSVSEASEASASTTTMRLSLGAFAPLIVRPAGRFYVGIGPNVLFDVLASASRGEAVRERRFGFLAQVGGWF